MRGASGTPDTHPTDDAADRARRRLLDAAQSLVEGRGGVGVALDLTMEEVQVQAGVSRSTMYRAWPRREDFERDVLCDLAGPAWQGTAAFDEETVLLGHRIVAERIGELTSEEGRWRVMREAVRQAATRNFDAVTGSPQWRTYVALTATVRTMSSDETRTEIVEALQRAEAVFIGRMVDFYSGMAKILGFRLRDPSVGLEGLAALGASVVEGMGLRQVVNPDVAERRVNISGPDGPEEWSLAALGFLGIVTQLMMPDPEYDFGSALEEYLKDLALRNP